MAPQVMNYKVSVHGNSDIGLVRQNNEDRWKQLLDEQFFILADGMGGHQAGEIASREAVDLLCSLFRQRYDSSLQKDLARTKKMLFEIIQEVNAYIYQMSRTNHTLKGMGTTLCCFLLHPEGMVFAHVGDSRIYLYREFHLEQLTHDHSLLQELIDLGQLSEQQAEDFLYKNIITKAVGTEAYVEPTVKNMPLRAGDVILMCSDGLTDMVSYEDIQSIIRKYPEDEIHLQLTKLAMKNGGFDNITIVVVKIHEVYETHLP